MYRYGFAFVIHYLRHFKFNPSFLFQQLTINVTQEDDPMLLLFLEKQKIKKDFQENNLEYFKTWI